MTVLTETDILLIQLMEEAAEVQKVCSKALRFGGLEEIEPAKPMQLNNAERISREINDFLAVAKMLLAKGKIPGYHNMQSMDEKTEKVKAFMEYSRKIGSLLME